MRSNRRHGQRSARRRPTRRSPTATPTATGARPGLPRFLQSGANASASPAIANAGGDARAASSAISGWASRFDLPPCCDELDEAKRWASTHSGPEDIIGAGGHGGFTAWYFPFGGPGVLHLVQGVATDCKDTLVSAGGTITPHPDLPATPEITALAARIQAMPEPARSIALADYQWSGAGEQTAWLGQLEQLVEQAWSFEHSFFLNQPCWDWIGADVNVDIRMHDGPKQADDHMDLEAYKLPVGESLRNYSILQQVSPGSGRDARDQSMRLDTSSTRPRQPSLLQPSVEFAHDSAALTPATETALRGFIARFNGATAHPAFSRSRIDLVGRASSSGSTAYNLGLSRERAEAVRDFLRDNGLTDVEIRVHVDAVGERDADQTTDSADDRRVDLLVDGGQHMFTATHEFGHAFGLDDEYAGTGRPVGSDAEHHDMVRAMTDANGNHLPGAAREHTGGIMSFGNEVRPQHYATFHHALETITAKSPWALGTATELADTEAVCSGAGMPPCTGDTCVASQLPNTDPANALA